MRERALEIGSRGSREGLLVYWGNAFVEDEEGILHKRMRFEEPVQEFVRQAIADRSEYHSLVMTHEHIDGRSVAGALEVD